jgi:[protein-PII] uridylyltransferase
MLDLHWDEPPVGAAPRDTLVLGPSAPVARRMGGAERLSPCARFVDRGGTIESVDPDSLRGDPGALLPLFAFMQTDGGRLHHDLIEQVRDLSKRRVRARFRNDPEVGAAFRELLEGRDVFRILAAMHRTGFLGGYIPEFGATFCQAQHNRAHLYTVDVHCLYAVRELQRLGDPSAATDTPAAAAAWAAAATKGPLLLAGLLHDIAKSHGAAHSRVGAEMVPRILGRMGYDDASIERTRWLVRYHLVLSDTAYHRDLQDPRTHATLRAVIGTKQRLDDLMALTWADSRATNLKGFTSWRQGLLEDAYRTATVVIVFPDEGPKPERRVEILAQVEALLAVEVGRRRAPEVLERLTRGVGADRPLYLETTPPEVLVTHAVLLDRLEAGEEFPAHAREPLRTGASEWTVAARDRPGLLSLLSGSLTSAGLSIVGAETHTRVDGTCVDVFRVVDGRGKPVSARSWRRVEQTLARVHRGEADLEALVRRAVRSAAPPQSAGAMDHQRVDVRNDLSDTATVVEVVVLDRPGLVWELTRALSRFGLDVRVAKIATRMDLASDTFYVVDEGGGRLDDARRQALADQLQSTFLSSSSPRSAR